ncbi:MAG: succinylglutamate desuccinylase/aspartoacylase family protein [Cytophagales bacterium]|nr:succinylglutamate desuccinylase/aspartoacylase family protein [Cytophagales bacterium]
MPKVYSKALDQHLDIDRIIGRIDGPKNDPCVVFFAGIHGNEPSGVFALHQALQEIRENNTPVQGTIIGISGNLWALERGERYHQVDLNRIWTLKQMAQIEAGTFQPENEDEREQLEIYRVLDQLFQEQKGPFYFFDLHTTSGETIPFIPVNDSLLNRKFAKQFPIPLILGIEEHLEGPILSYLNELGYVSFGFEAGQHDELSSIDNHRIFIYLSLVFSQLINKQDVAFDQYMDSWLRVFGKHHSFFEIRKRYEVAHQEKFVMEKGFSNFQHIPAGTLLAHSNGNPIHAEISSTMFMPLYQAQGNDGYFLIRKIPDIFLWLSKILRKFKMDRLVTYLPGVQQASTYPGEFVLNLRIARIMAKPILHLLGYRSRHIDEHHLTIKSREFQSKNRDYREALWYAGS